MVSKTSSSKPKNRPPPVKNSRNTGAEAQQQNQRVAPRADHVMQSPKDQQTLLDIFANAFAAVLLSDQFPTLLQEIKHALFNRDFDIAFGNEEYLETYAARWSPTRTLCYASILLRLRKYIDCIVTHALEPEQSAASVEAVSLSSETIQNKEDNAHKSKSQSRLRMLCLGGCAAEHVAFASYIRSTNSPGALTLLDSGPWAQVTSLLQNSLTTAPVLSKYASAAAKASNKPLVESSQLDFTFTQADALELTEDRLVDITGSQPLVVTLLFTLNELYTNGGIGKTTKFLRVLGKILPPESLLLVVDSPGSYSEAVVGKEKKKKKYPMQWLLNHTLLESENQEYAWEQLESHDSLWFRLPEGLTYPIRLENMRYQMHLYRFYRT